MDIHLKDIHIYLVIGSDILKKNFLIIFFLVFLLCGCKVKYNIEFLNDEVYEDFSVILDKTKEKNSIKYFDENKLYASLVPDMIEYKKEKNETEKNSIFNYSYKYNIDNYSDSLALSNCFKAYSVIKEDNYYMITTTEGVKCMTSDYSTIIDNIDVVIKTNHKVISTNADETSRCTYTWHINKDNYEKKSIFLKVYQNKYVFNYKEKSTFKLILIVSITLIVIIVGSILIIKKKVSNKI